MAEHDEHRLTQTRRNKLKALRDDNFNFPNDFRPTHTAQALHDKYKGHDREELKGMSQKDRDVTVAGRMMSVRTMGKGSFATLRDRTGDIQLWLKPDNLSEATYKTFQDHYDIGDIIGVTGHVFKTRTGELTVNAQALHLLTKSLRPLPEKFHGLTDVEERYRRRYLDLLMNKDSRAVFEKRSKIVSLIRRYFDQRGFVEVETPMMQPLAGGAKAQPFVTHHNALDRPLYLRIAPELYLKRLVIGGIERVYEINRNFRNEGVSSRHNPEFTMLEFYQTHADYRDLMKLTEGLFKYLYLEVCGGEVLESAGQRIDFSKPFAQISIAEAVLKQHPQLQQDELKEAKKLMAFAQSKGIAVEASASAARLLMAIFEKTVEPTLHAPTFVTGYPAEVSPLARRSDQDPSLADRFELFVAAQEIANGFSELNDAEDQRQRFEAQMQARAEGDEEAMPLDEDYLTALEYGLPPTAGEGIGIDRLVMLFTGAKSIRDVILFPQMKEKA